MAEDTIPEDIMELAAFAVKIMPLRTPTLFDVQDAIARAIRAEREDAARYLEECGDFGDDMKAAAIRKGEHRA
jgi:hypothetical protein